ncbi:MAG: archaetidylserine decarboxylase [Proteobacteria bacterium]|nr:archaetidylserine decarboxylase [Pseudomonadota bacterium]
MFRFARIENVWFKNKFTHWFVKSYRVNLSEALRENVEDYQHFNDFFTRALKPDARKIDSSDLICPVDGAVSQAGKISHATIFQAKKHYYTVSALLGGDYRADQFESGAFATIYLSPKDYHRIHMPYDAKLISMDYIPGDLFSVNQATAEGVENLFARNERVVCYFQTQFGLCAFVLVGAIFVGSMQTVWEGQINPPYQKQVQHFDYTDQDINLKKGEEMGRFNMGSTVVMLMPNQDNALNLNAGQTVQMGESLV